MKHLIELSIFVVVFCLELGAERIRLFERFNPVLYHYWNSIRPAHSTSKLPIVLIDISDWTSTNGLLRHPAIPTLWTRRDVGPTDRYALLALVEKLARLKPKAIGIDIDFSLPPSPLPPPAGQFQFLDRCEELTMSNSLSIFLGIARPFQSPPREWLGGLAYTNLAVGLWRQEGDNLFLPMGYQWQIKNGESNSLPSLSAALAQKAGFFKPRLEQFLTQTEEVPLPPATSITSKLTRFLVDYQNLSSLANGCLLGSQILDPKASPYVSESLLDRIPNSLVLIGDVRAGEQADFARIPTEDEPVPAFLIHACALATLLNHPLFQVGHEAGFLLAVLTFLSTKFLTRLVLAWRNGRVETASEAWRFEVAFEFIFGLFVVFAFAVAGLALNIVPLALFSNCGALLIEFWIRVIKGGKDTPAKMGYD